MRFIATLALLLFVAPAGAQDRGRSSNRNGPPKPEIVSPREGNRIAWYGTLQAARDESKRTGRPILFVSAAPHCGTTPGVW